MKLRHEVWLPHLKFTLQTMSLNYPLNPNEVTIRKYYNFIQNLPVFFPDEPMGKFLAKLLDDFPCFTLFKFKNIIYEMDTLLFNKINKKLNLKTVSFYESLEEYYQHYKPKELINKETIKNKKITNVFGNNIFIISYIIV